MSAAAPTVSTSELSVVTDAERAFLKAVCDQVDLHAAWARTVHAAAATDPHGDAKLRERNILQIDPGGESQFQQEAALWIPLSLAKGWAPAPADAEAGVGAGNPGDRLLLGDPFGKVYPSVILADTMKNARHWLMRARVMSQFPKWRPHVAQAIEEALQRAEGGRPVSLSPGAGAADSADAGAGVAGAAGDAGDAGDAGTAGVAGAAGAAADAAGADAVDRLLAELWTRAHQQMYRDVPAHEMGNVVALFQTLDALERRPVSVRTATAGQRALYLATRPFANPAIRIALGLYLGYKAFLLSRACVRWAQGEFWKVVVPQMSVWMQQAPPPVAQAIGTAIRGGSWMWRYRFPILVGLSLARLSGRGQGVIRPLHTVWDKITSIPGDLMIMYPLRVARFVFDGNLQLSERAQTQVRDALNRRDKSDLELARQRWMTLGRRFLNFPPAA